MSATPRRRPPAERLILGLAVFSHDNAAALLRGGEVLFAAEQERFDRVRHSRALPLDAVEAALRHAGVSFADLDDVVINYDPARMVWGYLRHIWRYLPRSLRMLCEPRRYRNALRLRGYRAALGERFGDLSHLRWHAVGHHLAHAASAFFRSGFERAAVLTSDALGEFDAAGFALGEGNRLRMLASQPYPHSLGAVYSAVTDHLGFEIYAGEGKVMGLAGYGRPDPARALGGAIRCLPQGRFEVNLDWFRYHVMPFVHEGWTTPRFAARFGPPRSRGAPLRDRHADLARALQDLSDQVTIHLCRYLRETTGLADLCYAGGSALNAYGNTKALTEGGFARLFVQPAANDGGTALGAALFHAHQTLDLPREPREGGTFLGPAFGEDACEEALRRAGVPFSRPPDLGAATAARLAQGRVVGWFQGRLEFGPRALGHRSILADPRPARLRDRLNAEIKRREGFRPFAPMVPVEEADRFFAMPARELPYMLFIVPVRPEWRERLAAITHVDGTTRVQTVDRAAEPLTWDLLRAFERESGVPVLLNTSFNGPGEPIVCTPAEAVASWRRHGLDDLVLGPFLSRTP